MGMSSTDLWMIIRARDEASRAIRAVGRSFHALDKDGLAAANRQLDRGRALTTMGVGITAVGAAGFYALERLGKGAREYEKQAALALTQTDGVNASLKDLKDIGLDVARTVPVAFDEIQPALYDIFSSIDTNLEGSRKLLKQFARDSVAGGTDISTATRSMLQILNAYHIKVKDVSKVSDFMFQLVRKGVGDYNQMAAAIGRSIPSAQRAGQSYQELGGMIAFMTRNGLTAAQAGTSAARALDAMSNPKTVAKMEAMGIRVRNSAGEFRNMSDIVEDLGKKLQGMPSPKRAAALYELFKGSGGTIQARRFFDLVFKNMDEYQQRVGEMKNTTGLAAQAFNIASRTSQAEQDKAINNLKAMQVELGDVYNTIRTKVIKALGTLAGMFGQLPDKVKKGIIIFTLLASTFAVLVGTGTILAGVFLMMSATAMLMGTSLGAIVATMGIVLVAIAALAAAGYLIYKNWDQIGPKLQAVWDGIKAGASAAWDWIIKTFGSNSDIGKTAIQGFEYVKSKLNELLDAGKEFYAQLKPILDAIGDAWGPVTTALGNAFDWLKPKIVGIAQAFASTFGPTLQATITIVASIVGMIIQIFTGLVQFFTGILMVIRGIFTGNFGLIKDGVIQILQGLWTGVSAVFVAGWNAVVAGLKGFVQSVINFFKRIYDVIVGHSIVPDLVKAVVKWFASLPGKVIGAIASLPGKLFSAFTSAMSRGLSAIGTGIGKIVGKLRDIPGKAVSALGNLGSTLKNAGSSLINGFINGIKDKFGDVKDTLGGLAKKAVSWKGPPSYDRVVLTRNGQLMIEGFMRGLQSRYSDVKRSLQDFTRSLAADGAISVNMNSQNPSGPPAPYFPPRPPVDPGGAGGPQTYNDIDIEINTQEIDPRKHAADLGILVAERMN